MSKYRDGLSISTKLAFLYLIMSGLPTAYQFPTTSLKSLVGQESLRLIFGILSLITVLTKPCHLTLCWATELIHSTPWQPPSRQTHLVTSLKHTPYLCLFTNKNYARTSHRSNACYMSNLQHSTRTDGQSETWSSTLHNSVQIVPSLSDTHLLSWPVLFSDAL